MTATTPSSASRLDTSTLSARDLSELGAGLPDLIGSALVETLAVLATFDPDEDVPEGLRLSVEQISDRLTASDGRPEWILKERIRIDVLARLLAHGGRRRLARARKGAKPRDTPLQRLLDAVVYDKEIKLDSLSEEELVAALHVGRWCAAAGSLARAPKFAIAFDRDRIEGRLALIETTRPLREITRDGCVGREAELERLRLHVEGPEGPVNLLGYPALLLYGIGGVGKSTLVAQFLLELADRTEPVAWAYLDLDRPSLSTYDPLILLADVIRQVGAQFPRTRRFLDLAGLEGREAESGSGLESEDFESWREVVPRLADAINKECGGRLVVVIDTFEELQREEERRPDTRLSDLLYRMLTMLSDYTERFRLVVAGRAPALVFLSSMHTDQRLHVEAFRGDSAVAVLRHLYHLEQDRLVELKRRDERLSAALPPPAPFDDALAREVVETVGGSPLTLKLAARVLALEGKSVIDDSAARARAIGKVADEFVTGFLYHRILGHIRGVSREKPQDLRDVAEASLPLRMVNADLLGEVVLPALGRTDLHPARLIDGLIAETALADTEDGVMRLRDELRGPALLALRYIKPELVDDVHQRAATYYASHPQLPHAAGELAYHRLASGVTDGVHDLDPVAIAEAERSVVDLPAESRDLVRSTLADPGSLSQSLHRQAVEREIEAAAIRALAVGDLDEAARLLADDQDWTATTKLHRLVAQLEEARGRLGPAAAAARRDLQAAAVAREPERYSAAAVRVALLEERLHRAQKGAVVLGQAEREPWLAGQVLLRLELLLNQLAMLERTEVGSSDADDRWVLNLDARALLSKAEPAAVRSTTALVRLLAATLGRDEPAWVLEAVRFVGLGTSRYSTHSRNLARALAAWDLDRPEAGAIASGVGLSLPGPMSLEALTEVWFQAVLAPTPDTSALLDRAFSAAQPSPDVVEALRSIYLWWGLDPQELAFQDESSDEETITPSAEPSAHFLDEPLDLKDPAAQRLLRTMSGAYPTTTDLQVLASSTGIHVESVDYKQTRGMTTRSLLVEAGRTGHLGDLIGYVLADPAAASFHTEIRELIGPDWLNEHGIQPA
jgi:hypothetical protein